MHFQNVLKNIGTFVLISNSGQKLLFHVYLSTLLHSYEVETFLVIFSVRHY
jgi:hypothetical protein